MRLDFGLVLLSLVEHVTTSALWSDRNPPEQHNNTGNQANLSVATQSSGKRQARSFNSVRFFEPSIAFPTCLVHDGTEPGMALINEVSGEPCSLLGSLQRLLQPNEDVYLPLTGVNKANHIFTGAVVRLISTGNPLANLFLVDPTNFTVVTQQAVDREAICTRPGLPQQTVDCCAASRMECNLPMTLLVRLESNGRGKPRNRKD
ncbi:unnamed protein product, partial [Protopolystoma xenopodis]